MTQLLVSIQAKIDAPAGPPLEEAQNFLRAYFGDEGCMDVVRSQIKRDVASASKTLLRNRPLTRAVQAIETLLANPSNGEALTYLVFWDANHPLEDSSNDIEARAWLSEVAEMIREELGDKQPPRPGA